MTTKEELPDDAILIKGESKIFTEPSEPETERKSLRDLRGTLKYHKETYSSVELQHQSTQWRKNISD